MAQVDQNSIRQPVCFASKSLTQVEQRYSQIEREMLAITWAVERFHMYVFGRDFTVFTDHQPLLPIFKKRNSVPSVRIHRWLLKLQSYHMRARVSERQKQPG